MEDEWDIEDVGYAIRYGVVESDVFHVDIFQDDEYETFYIQRMKAVAKLQELKKREHELDCSIDVDKKTTVASSSIDRANDIALAIRTK